MAQMKIKQYSAFLSLLMLASLVFVSSAGGHRKFMSNFPREIEKKGAVGIRHRVLWVKAKDYENYEPAPSLSKPVFKVLVLCLWYRVNVHNV
ncbi:hypothetical protein HPP92_017821 [Vanilla planifolia]|uniref:Uncharacterized protein n=1 Tax=Vanilla planifolia TaxID=51239 RepID=A0A835QBT7_VANPL|nr:hypothetical protein HPP92_017821 [Vanilla planifolia]